MHPHQPLDDKCYWQVLCIISSLRSHNIAHQLDEHPLVTAYAGAKQRIAALEQQIQNLQDAVVK